MEGEHKTGAMFCLLGGVIGVSDASGTGVRSFRSTEIYGR
jgi:hypothetical protein